jgi:hypothetical protein
MGSKVFEAQVIKVLSKKGLGDKVLDMFPKKIQDIIKGFGTEGDDPDTPNPGDGQTGIDTTGGTMVVSLAEGTKLKIVGYNAATDSAIAQVTV